MGPRGRSALIDSRQAPRLLLVLLWPRSFQLPNLRRATTLALLLLRSLTRCETLLPARERMSLPVLSSGKPGMARPSRFTRSSL